MLIKNFGHLWERRYINYGQGRERGHLRGYVRKLNVDFREQIGVYVLYNKDLLPVYVGQAGNGNATLFSRLKTHETDHLWNRWESFSWFGIKGITPAGTLSMSNKVSNIFKSPGSYILNEFEAILISSLEPRLNKQGAKWKDVTEFFQEIDGKLNEVTNYEIINKLEDIEKLVKSLSKKKKPIV